MPLASACTTVLVPWARRTSPAARRVVSPLPRLGVTPTLPMRSRGRAAKEGDPVTRRRVLLADDHAATRQRWRELLEPEFEIVGAVGDGQALIEAAERLAPDVIVTDIVMPH